MVKTPKPICVLCGKPHQRGNETGRKAHDQRCFSKFCTEVLNLGDDYGLDNLPDDLPVCEDCINSLKVIVLDRRLTVSAEQRVKELEPANQLGMMLGELTTLKRHASWVVMDAKAITEIVKDSRLPKDGNGFMGRVRGEMLKVEPASTTYFEEISRRLDSTIELKRFLDSPVPLTIPCGEGVQEDNADITDAAE